LKGSVSIDFAHCGGWATGDIPLRATQPGILRTMPANLASFAIHVDDTARARTF
jgi:hypothetical protein